jgi:hypothetical protein
MEISGRNHSHLNGLKKHINKNYHLASQKPQEKM